MKTRSILVAIVVALLVSLVLAPLALAQEPDPATPGAEGMAGLYLLGKVTDVQDAQLSVETSDGPWTVLVDDETVIRLPGVEDPTLEDVVGKAILVKGRVTAVGTMQAQLITPPAPLVRLRDALRDLLRLLRRRGIRGQVEAINGETMTLSTSLGQITVRVSEDTRFRGPGAEPLTLEDIEVGDTIVVLGLPDITCPINAKGIILLPGENESSS